MQFMVLLRSSICAVGYNAWYLDKYLTMWASLASVQLEMMMSRGWWSVLVLVLEASDGWYKETSGSSFSMKEMVLGEVSDAGAAADMML